MSIILLNILDVITTIFQSFLIVWACNNISPKENKISKFKSVVLIIIVSSVVIGFSYSNLQLPYANLIAVTLCLLFCIFFYRKSYIDAIIGFGVIYSVIVISSYFFLYFYQYSVTNLKLGIAPEFQMVLLVFVPSWIVYLAFYILGRHIFSAILLMKTYVNSMIFFIITLYAMIVLDTIRAELQANKVDLVFKPVFYFTVFLISVLITVYFARVNEKSKEVELLNSALKEKITELRKVKHDYGSEISGLFGLYQLGKYDKLGDMLKNIVERNQSMNTSVFVNLQASPLVNSILKPIASTNIDIIVFDSAEYENLSVTDNELFKVLSNIIRNSVDVLKDVKNPIIKFKSYNNKNGIIITISNNGEEIPKDKRDKIFETGFTTKNNPNGDRGYGLSIVKEIIDKCNGKITIDSDKEYTQFNIEIPYN